MEYSHLPESLKYDRYEIRLASVLDEVSDLEDVISGEGYVSDRTDAYLDELTDELKVLLSQRLVEFGSDNMVVPNFNDSGEVVGVSIQPGNISAQLENLTYTQNTQTGDYIVGLRLATNTREYRSLVEESSAKLFTFVPIQGLRYIVYPDGPEPDIDDVIASNIYEQIINTTTDIKSLGELLCNSLSGAEELKSQYYLEYTNKLINASGVYLSTDKYMCLDEDGDTFWCIGDEHELLEGAFAGIRIRQEDDPSQNIQLLVEVKDSGETYLVPTDTISDIHFYQDY